MGASWGTSAHDRASHPLHLGVTASANMLTKQERSPTFRNVSRELNCIGKTAQIAYITKTTIDC